MGVGSAVMSSPDMLLASYKCNCPTCLPTEMFEPACRRRRQPKQQRKLPRPQLELSSWHANAGISRSGGHSSSCVIPSRSYKYSFVAARIPQRRPGFIGNPLVMEWHLTAEAMELYVGIYCAVDMDRVLPEPQKYVE